MAARNSTAVFRVKLHANDVGRPNLETNAKVATCSPPIARTYTDTISIYAYENECKASQRESPTTILVTDFEGHRSLLWTIHQGDEASIPPISTKNHITVQLETK